MVTFRLVAYLYHQVFANSKPSVFSFADHHFLQNGGKKLWGQKLPKEMQQRGMHVIPI